ncbi:16S rRNA (guanine(527)-N(7))-methyltransferase RsmG [Sphingomonas sanguinis]|jgi:16S rRNA (guanine527-N7)-methyltransferase|uniref:Ribosomal RNA small subunit methyltransferase G n=1 Tax=Sphingomonas sanguinis TaxID=33051 RepID=A0A7Y7QVA5_9SPHN|nr:16S rRNA (guanine(527)-N(7))-methyltransferase RsmG [Sphingomonas sanguinis]MBZ6381771.1 16S rRNA (guanine(527)-N(7))-methyltransferase RsmG [Sphingomonas sanguinis]NNG48375.1 16S rRNA (guanine(527)-N(7))-methyltransferase RsmG [Sphingomonas sanguinis]NNG53997.1 16S rRNA (guanine(527)-N(7))-methyltransferase RsmG [Sphingomonas sanguinis]NVP31071.1 16S rRNA (guanine(527)-N(7))-methyltransferase RsmG [Sphingomonas sanguinis]HJO65970.1 16S rRNA (guanine(527)-N(7))-methyltransferase RsmG [Sphin
MTEEQARDWVVQRYGEEAAERIDYFLNLVIVENDQQNLIAPSTIATIWARHALDSVQLIPLADRADGQWVDIGTGGGFPGMVVALAWPGRMALVEPRKRRADFLRECAERLGVADRVTVYASKIEAVDVKADVISARAVATVENLLRAAAHCGKQDTRWLLPRGRLDEREIKTLKRQWRFVFHVEHSITSAESSIVILDRVGAR